MLKDSRLIFFIDPYSNIDMIRSILLLSSLFLFLSTPVFSQLAYTDVDALGIAEGSIIVNINSSVEDIWETTGDVELASKNSADIDELSKMNLLLAETQETMLLLEELEAFEEMDLQLASFSAGREKNHINLEWAAATHADIVSFFVQRSTDAENWEDVGMLRIPDAAMPLEEYSYIDNHPFQGSNFYRLKQKDLSGMITYSDVVAVEMLESGSHTMHLFPSPAIFGATINLNIREILPVHISLVDANLQTIATVFSDQTSIGRHTVELNLDELPRGKYTCLIEVGSELAERVLVK